MSTPAAGHRPGATPEEVWAAQRPAWPAWRRDPGWRRVVVCAAHPDDEVLGVGGTMALLAAAGVDLVHVAVTDGEASHPGNPVLGPADLAAARERESGAALAALGVAPVDAVRLRLPDSGVAEHEAGLTDALAPVLAGADLVLTTWTGDGHPDHEAVGRATVAAAGALGVPVAQYPVWAWHWSHPGDPRLPWDRARAVALPPGVRDAKRAAVACFTTQVHPLGPDPAVLPPEFLAHADRDHEVLW
ncbi:PIG-L deacetylase family protein [Klenkia brasiliensis]|uniref:N-acetylglucosaminyl deacetylase, LmbE family n=1 Tax=Klenkia brasiliensis TaxID=333142 RepID=A0A1G7VC24_9ACTN|nr:PIG-L deacetylase family protein [Klenkia brasiliensis]SDG56510.1 N-acetylglucosaminyl deacetylase, LmbE family [Klenkia brasiliensis]